MATEYETYLRRYLNDNGTIWTSAQLENWALEAEQEIVKRVPCIVDRIALDIQAGNPFYTIPDTCIGIRRITWLGYKIYPLTKLEVQDLYPQYVVTSNFFGTFSNAFSSAFFLAGSSSGTTTGRPYHWAYSGYAWNKIQLFPTPGMSIGSVTSGLWDSAIRDRCIVEFYRLPDTTSQVYRVPSYARRYLVKDYVLAKAFAIEGIGQDLAASAWHGDRFNLNLEIFSSINSGVFVSKKQRLGFKDSLVGNTRGKAMLPPQFGPQSWR